MQKGVSEWMANWKRNNWRTSAKKPVNQDLWERLDKQVGRHDVQWVWVKGHAGHKENDIVDALANRAAKKTLANHQRG